SILRTTGDRDEESRRSVVVVLCRCGMVLGQRPGKRSVEASCRKAAARCREGKVLAFAGESDCCAGGGRLVWPSSPFARREGSGVGRGASRRTRSGDGKFDDSRSPDRRKSAGAADHRFF